MGEREKANIIAMTTIASCFILELAVVEVRGKADLPTRLEIQNELDHRKDYAQSKLVAGHLPISRK